jgi:putative ABC transport system ATP-binding protein
MPPLISLSEVSKLYDSAAGPITALRDLCLGIDEGEFVAVIGKSGSGKTTLINLLTGIDSPTSGTIRVAATAVHALSQEQLARWRGKSVGIVFQFFQLLPTLTVAENVMLPMDFCNTFAPAERRGRALRLLSEMGIADQANKLPAALSGGQQQRAAIARALANDPPLIVADEPTGNLDSRTAAEIMAFFAQLVRAGKTVVMATHERDLQRYFARSITLADGALADGALIDGALADSALADEALVDGAPGGSEVGG